MRIVNDIVAIVHALRDHPQGPERLQYTVSPAEWDALCDHLNQLTRFGRQIARTGNRMQVYGMTVVKVDVR